MIFFFFLVFQWLNVFCKLSDVLVHVRKCFYMKQSIFKSAYSNNAEAKENGNEAELNKIWKRDKKSYEKYNKYSFLIILPSKYLMFK